MWERFYAAHHLCVVIRDQQSLHHLWQSTLRKMFCITGYNTACSEALLKIFSHKQIWISINFQLRWDWILSSLHANYPYWPFHYHLCIISENKATCTPAFIILSAIKQEQAILKNILQVCFTFIIYFEGVCLRVTLMSKELLMLGRDYSILYPKKEICHVSNRFWNFSTI